MAKTPSASTTSSIGRAARALKRRLAGSAQENAEGMSRGAQSAMKRRSARKQMLQSLDLVGATGAEVGVFKGNFSKDILEAVKPEKLYLIDPWQNFDDPGLSSSWYHAKSSNDMEAVFRDVSDRFSTEVSSGQVEILRGKSQDRVPEIPDASLDFAYIDGDHRFEGVLEDLRILNPKIKVGGYLILDDYMTRGWWGDGVVRGLNVFLGEHPDTWRFVLKRTSQVVIRKMI